MTELTLEKHFSIQSDGMLIAFDQVEKLNVGGQQIDLNYATL